MKNNIKKIIGISTSVVFYLSIFLIDFVVNICFDCFFGEQISFDLFEILCNMLVLLLITIFFYKIFKWEFYEIDICKDDLHTKISNLKNEKFLVCNDIYFIYHSMLSMLGYKKVIVIFHENKATVIGNRYYLYKSLNS